MIRPLPGRGVTQAMVAAFPVLTAKGETGWYRISRSAADEIEAALTPPGRGLIEWTPGARLSALAAAGLADGGLVVSLLTGSAFHQPLSHWLAVAAGRAFSLNADFVTILDLVLGEALANALVHGNLGVGSDSRRDRDSFINYGHAIETRLGLPAFARRRVEISLRAEAEGGVNLAVLDEGGGFDFRRVLTCPHTPSDKSGRGLTIIRQLASRVVLAESGRRLEVTLNPEDAG